MNVGLNYQVFLNAGTRIERNKALKVNGETVVEALRKAILTGAIAVDSSSEIKKFTPNSWLEKAIIEDADGRTLAVESAYIHFKMQVVHFFGYLDDLSKTVALINLSEKNSNILFKAEELFEYKERFSAFSRLEDVPLSTQPLKLRAVAAPEFSMSEGSLTMQHLQSGKKYSFPTSGGEEPIQVK